MATIKKQVSNVKKPESKSTSAGNGVKSTSTSVASERVKTEKKPRIISSRRVWPD